MRYYRCECGKAESWSSMGSPMCRACSSCGKTLAEGPDGHRDPIPHHYTTLFEHLTGKPYFSCTNCGRREEIPDAKPITAKVAVTD